MSQTYQRTDSCGLSCPTVTHDHDTPDIRINYVHDCSKFHLLLLSLFIDESTQTAALNRSVLRIKLLLLEFNFPLFSLSLFLLSLIDHSLRTV